MRKIAILAIGLVAIVIMLAFASTALAAAPHGNYGTGNAPAANRTDLCLSCHDVHNAAGDYVLMREATVTAVCSTCHVVYGESVGSEPSWTEPPCPGTPDNAGADGYSSGCSATLNNANAYPEASVSPTSAYENLTPVSGHRLGNVKDDPDYIPASTSTLRVIRSEDYEEGEIYDHNPASSLSATAGLYCASCHTPHGSLTTVSLADGTAIPKPTATYNTSGAVTGYFFTGDQLVEASGGSTRAPAQWLLSSNPNHLSARASGFSATYTEAGTGTVYNVSGMAPVNPVKGRDEFCIRCHDKQWNGTDFEGHAFGEGTSDLANHPPLCMSCHGPRGNASTGWQSAGDFPHTSMNYKILSKDSDGLCLGCHSGGRLP